MNKQLEELAQPVAEVVSKFGDVEAFGEREIKLLAGIQQMAYGTKFYSQEYVDALQQRVAELEAIKVSEGKVWMVYGVGLPLYVTEETEYITRRKKRDAESLFTKGIVDELRQHIARQEKIILNQDESLSIRRGELEIAQQRIAELESCRRLEYTRRVERENYRLKKELDNESAANAHAYDRIRGLEAKLATPVQLQNCDFESVAIMAHWCTDEQLKAWVKGVEHAKKKIREAGFKVEGDA